MRLTLSLALGLALWAAPLAAQDKADNKKASPPPSMASMMPKPGPEMAKIKGMVGTWNVAETMEASPMGPAGKGHGVTRVSLGPGGLSIIIDHRSTAGHMKGFKGHGVIAWDGEAKVYKQIWTDNMMPMIMVATGAWGGDNFVMTSEGTMMGKPFKERDTYSGIGTDKMEIIFEMSMDGSPMTKNMTMVFTRAKAAEAKPAETKDEAKK